MHPLAPRVDALEAQEAIRQLVARHAYAVDRRALDELADLYVPDAVTPDGRTGRPAVAAWWAEALAPLGVTFHLLGSHVIDLVDDDHATGVLYARPEAEIGDRWMVQAVQYWDRYRRVDGTWLLAERETHAFYVTDLTEDPLTLDGRASFPVEVHHAVVDLPERFPTWQARFGDAAPIGTPVAAAPTEREAAS